MSLSRFDLNLFTVFDAIYREGGITAASRRLNLSQPAVSHALARLRELVADPLFERQGNTMVPTAKARAMAGAVGRSLEELTQLLQQDSRFDPATHQRRVIIAANGANERQFLPGLVAALAARAPGIEVATVRVDRGNLEEDLRSGELDLAIDVDLPLAAGIRSEPLTSDHLVVLARADHPQVPGTLDRTTYLALGHVLVTGRRRGAGFEDLALGRLGVERSVRVRCQRYDVASAIVAQTDLLATLPRGQAEPVARADGNQVLTLPFELPALALKLYWHGRADDDAALGWVRDLLRDAVRPAPRLASER